MDFAFSDEQLMLAGQARSFLADKLPPEKVAEQAEAGESEASALWPQIAELGWIGLATPEDAGGAGMAFLDEVVLFEQLGYALYPGPYFSSVALALPALAGSPDLARRVTSGEVSATLGWIEPEGPYSLDSLEDCGTKAERSGESWRLSGSKDLVPTLAGSGIVVVAARAADGVGLWAVEPGGEGVTVTELHTVDRTRPAARLELEDAPATLVADPASAGKGLATIRQRALVAAAAEAVGIAQKALDLASAYVKERQQFDKPIGAYQAVAHQVADTYMDTELARSTTYWAAWSVSEGADNAGVAAAAAKATAGEAAVVACERAIQVHGGIGFTWEHVLHRYYKRAQWIEAFEGSAAVHRAAIADELFS